MSSPLRCLWDSFVASLDCSAPAAAALPGCWDRLFLPSLSASWIWLFLIISMWLALPVFWLQGAAFPVIILVLMAGAVFCVAAFAVLTPVIPMLDCCLGRCREALIPKFNEFNDVCSQEYYGVPDRLLWAVGEALHARIRRMPLPRPGMSVSYCVPLPELAGSQRADENFELQFRSRSVQIAVTTRTRNRIVCVLDVTAPADALKEQMLSEMGIPYRCFAADAGLDAIEDFVTRSALWRKKQPALLFTTHRTLLTAAQWRFVKLVLMPVARRWGARVLLKPDITLAARAADCKSGLCFDCLLVTHDGRYATGFMLRRELKSPAYQAVAQALPTGTAAIMDVKLHDRCPPGWFAGRVREHLRTCMGLKPTMENMSKWERYIG